MAVSLPKPHGNPGVCKLCSSPHCWVAYWESAEISFFHTLGERSAKVGSDFGTATSVLLPVVCRTCKDSYCQSLHGAYVVLTVGNLTQFLLSFLLSLCCWTGHTACVAPVVGRDPCEICMNPALIPSTARKKWKTTITTKHCLSFLILLESMQACLRRMYVALQRKPRLPAEPLNSKVELPHSSHNFLVLSLFLVLTVPCACFLPWCFLVCCVFAHTLSSARHALPLTHSSVWQFLGDFRINSWQSLSGFAILQGSQIPYIMIVSLPAVSFSGAVREPLFILCLSTSYRPIKWWTS